MAFDAKSATEQLIKWIRRYFVRNGDENTIAVLGMSGGKDSLVAAALCAQALGPDKVLGVMMPNGEQADIQDAIDSIAHLRIKSMYFNIGEMCRAHYEELEKTGVEITPIITTNVPARMRMASLYSIAAMEGGRVVCTSNYSERYIGYSTKWGDGVGDFAPLRDLTVSEIYAIGDYLELPKHLLYKNPSDGMTGKTDEEILGFTYKELDAYIREDKCPEDIEHLRKIVKRHEMSIHKIADIPTFYYRDNAREDVYF
jgi:NAD+ synthase